MQLVEALREVDGLVDVAGGTVDRPNFHFRQKPFLHFHVDNGSGGVYADVRFGGPSADLEPIWAATAAEREDPLRWVRKHVRHSTRR